MFKIASLDHNPGHHEEVTGHYAEATGYHEEATGHYAEAIGYHEKDSH